MLYNKYRHIVTLLHQCQLCIMNINMMDMMEVIYSWYVST